MKDTGIAIVLLPALLLTACSGGGGDAGTTTPPPPPPPPPPALAAAGQVSAAASPFAAECGLGDGGSVHLNAEVEPHLAVNPLNTSNLVGVWQQDRWSNGASRGNSTGASIDGGTTWVYRQLPFSTCAGGTFQRATDPWVTFGPTGTVFQMALGLSGGTFAVGSRNAMLVSRSTDGGLTWSPVTTLIEDTRPFFNDKNTITADPTDARYVYAAWDRLEQNGGGPAYFARTADGGATWESARAVHDPGGISQTIGTLVVVLPDGALVYLFTQLDAGPNGTRFASIRTMRSTDKGLTWSAPVIVGNLLTIGARDPETGAAIRDGAIIAQAAVGAGSIFVVWQDSRFSGGARDAIALSRSNDGGLTWSQPVRVNADANVTAFTPQVHVRADGMIGVTFFDLRSNTADAATLFADYWLARSADGLAWTETRVAGPFNLNTAPNAGGYFLGDYMGLGSTGTTFLPFYVRTTGDLTNRNDVFLTPIPAASAMQGYAAKSAPGVKVSPELAQRVSDNIVRAMDRRVPGWRTPAAVR